MRLIDADVIPEVSADPYEEAGFRSVLDEQPTVDAVPVVRCKDCRYFGNKVRVGNTFVCNKHGIYVPENGYCSEGKAK